MILALADRLHAAFDGGQRTHIHRKETGGVRVGVTETLPQRTQERHTMTIELSNEERETHFSMTADDRSAWAVYSDDPIMQRRLESIGATLTRIAPDGLGKHYTLPANQLSLRNAPKPLSDERKAQLANQLARRSKPPVITD